MLTYIGKGYSPAFTDNYDRIIARLSAGEDIVIIQGPDDICQPLLSTTEPHCYQPSVDARDARALGDIGKLLARTLQTGDVVQIDKAMLEDFRHAFVKGVTRAACDGCEWFDLCSAVSADSYAGVKLQHGCQSA